VIWAGVDVGGRRKGFHLTVIDSRLVDRQRAETPSQAVEWLASADPELVAVDSPRTPARSGETTRDCERRLAAEVCGIRWTPDAATLDAGNPYYEWIVHGLELYEELGRADVRAVECFPNASWTRWGGPRNGRSRARWSHETLARLGLDGLPERLNQDWRDSIAAALTARAHSRGLTDELGEIVVPH
jgi:predicted nuclease with RNAse H fold